MTQRHIPKGTPSLKIIDVWWGKLRTDGFQLMGVDGKTGRLLGPDEQGPSAWRRDDTSLGHV